MVRNRLATMFMVFVTAIAGPAFAKSDSAKADRSEKSPQLGEAFTVLHAVGQWSVELSKMAEERAKSDLVKKFAHEVATANAEKDEKLMALAKKHGVEVAALDPQTEEGKSQLDRTQAETVLLQSLEGDAFDKEYMTLVTNTQQSVIHFLDAHMATAKDPDVKKFLTDMKTTVQKRLKVAQDIMAKVYGNRI